jgi:hypothetical protein
VEGRTVADLQPLKILVITSRPLVDPADRPITLLDVAEERKRIRTALKNAGAAIDVHFLPDATTGGINDALSHAWGVVHITGHGAPDGSLWFEDEFGVGQPLGARELLRMFGAQIPRVVVLSLCFSGRQAAEALRQAGVGAVVAIKADRPIADRAATLLINNSIRCWRRARR